MHTSFLSRSVIAVASLAIGSVALAATPANAATPSGVTREMVLNAARGFDNEGAQHSPPEDVIESFTHLIELTCDFDDQDGNEFYPSWKSFVNGNADGILITASLYEPSLGGENPVRYCTFAALATADASFSLSGTISVSITGDDASPSRSLSRPVAAAVQATPSTALSGNVFVTEPINVVNSYEIRSASLTASGNATRSVDVVATENAPYIKPRTAAGEKSSKAKYDKRLKAAAKWYAKKIKKAGTSKTKKAAATKTYTAKKAKYKKAYDKRYPGIKSSSKTTTQTENRPFNANVSAENRFAE